MKGISEDNKIINALWIGKELSSLELLTVKSFINNGHTFRLWVYYQIKTPLPPEVILMDANIVLPENTIFRYKYADQFGHGKGSLAGFSDIFRYKLLYDYGGWWVDMDVTCLKPFNFSEPYVFRPHHDMPVVGNIMKCPPESALMQYCYERSSREVDENNRDWHLPIQILNDGIKQMGLSCYIKNITNPESWYENRKMVIQAIDLPEEWYAIHWINEEWRRNGISKDYAGRFSVLRSLYDKYGVPVTKMSFAEKVRNRVKLSFSLSVIKYLWSYFLGYVSYYFRRR